MSSYNHPKIRDLPYISIQTWLKPIGFINTFIISISLIYFFTTTPPSFRPPFSSSYIRFHTVFCIINRFHLSFQFFNNAHPVFIFYAPDIQQLQRGFSSVLLLSAATVCDTPGAQRCTDQPFWEHTVSFEEEQVQPITQHTGSVVFFDE